MTTATPEAAFAKRVEAKLGRIDRRIDALEAKLGDQTTADVPKIAREVARLKSRLTALAADLREERDDARRHHHSRMARLANSATSPRRLPSRQTTSKHSQRNAIRASSPTTAKSRGRSRLTRSSAKRPLSRRRSRATSRSVMTRVA